MAAEGGRRRLLVLMHPIGRGGAVRSTAVLVAGLEGNSIEPALAVLDPRALPAVAEVMPPGMAVIDFGWRTRLHLPLAIWRLARYLGRERPELAMGVGTYASICLLAARRLSRHRPRVGVRELMDPRLLRRRNWPGGRLLAARQLYRGADAIVTTSQGMRNSVARHFGLPAGRVHVIANGYDPALEGSLDTSPDPPHPWLDGSMPGLLFVGRLVPFKGLHHLIEALAILRRQRAVRLLVLGEGPQRAQLEQQARAAGVADAIRFEGYVGRPYRHMAAAQAVVVPSLSEAFGNVILEAMRSGGVVIASDCDYGPRELLDGASGVLVPVGDPAALAAAIGRVLDDPVLAASLRAGAAERARIFSAAAMISRYEALFGELAQRAD